MAIDGILVIDKPAGMTSHDVIARLRRMLRERSIGHLGTLDPMATGVLPLVLGRMTRLAQFYLESAKAYEGELTFGTMTDTYDAEGEAVAFERLREPQSLSLDSIREAAAQFRGKLRQMPPPFSAKKIKGVPAYKLARKKQQPDLQPVEIEVAEFEIVSFSGERARFHSVVSSGTYIRSLAHELGIALGCGAHLSALRRTRAGEFSIEQAHTLEEIARIAEAQSAESSCQTKLDDLLIHPRKVLPEMPCVTAPPETIGWVRNGRAVNLPEMSQAKLVKVFASQSELVAIVSRIAGTLFQPKVVLAAAEASARNSGAAAAKR